MRGSKRAGISRKVKIEDEAGRQRRMTVILLVSKLAGSWVVFEVQVPVLSHKQAVDVTCPLWWRFEAWELIKDMTRKKTVSVATMQAGESQATLTN